MPNQVDRDNHYRSEKEACQTLLPAVVQQATKYLDGHYRAYQERTKSQIDAELSKLAELEEKHRDYQRSLFQNKGERKREEKMREVDSLFDGFTRWVNDSMTIENHPHIRVIAVLAGTKKEG